MTVTYNVLVVEDHPFQHEYLLNLFNEMGGVVLKAAHDGVEALELLKSHDFDMVLSAVSYTHLTLPTTPYV